MGRSIEEIAAAAKTAREAFEAACRSPTIGVFEYNAIRERYLQTMLEHHEALDLARAKHTEGI